MSQINDNIRIVKQSLLEESVSLCEGCIFNNSGCDLTINDHTKDGDCESDGGYIYKDYTIELRREKIEKIKSKII